MSLYDNVIDISSRFQTNASVDASQDPLANYSGPAVEITDVKFCDGTVITAEQIREAARDIVTDFWRPSLGLGD